MTIQNNLLIIIVIPSKAGQEVKLLSAIQVQTILKLMPPLFEKLPLTITLDERGVLLKSCEEFCANWTKKGQLPISLLHN
jgi:hypothetical protein